MLCGSFQFFAWIWLWIPLGGERVQALVLRKISHPSLFLSPVSARESRDEARDLDFFTLTLDINYDELRWISAREHSPNVSTCLVVDGYPCQCLSNQTIISLRLQIREISHLCLQPIEAPHSGWRKKVKPRYLSLLMKDSTDLLSSTPYRIQGDSHRINDTDRDLTLVLTLAFSDIARAIILIHTLKKIRANSIRKFLIIVPDEENQLIATALKPFLEQLIFPTKIMNESVLFARDRRFWQHQYPYATQMAIKLLISRFVETDYYLTLDADHVLLHSEPLNEIFQARDPTLNQVLAVYHHEGYSIHSFWWEGSKRLLGIAPFDEEMKSERLNFGVTPALLSTWGSLCTLSFLFESILSISALTCGSEMACSRERRGEEVEGIWLDYLGIGSHIWTEYTLYRLVLEKMKVFDELHFEENSRVYLHCSNVWFPSDIPWKSVEAAQNSSCLFSVLQSSAGITASSIYRDLRIQQIA